MSMKRHGNNEVKQLAEVKEDESVKDCQSAGRV